MAVKKTSLLRAAPPPLSFTDFVSRFPPAPLWHWGRHTKAIAKKTEAALEKLWKGKSSLLCVNIPPRHGKSLLISVALPAYLMLVSESSEDEVLLTSYSAQLSARFSRRARALMRDAINTAPELFGGVAFGDKDGASEFDMANGSSLLSVGLGGSVTGRGAKILILDDAIKNREEADSEVIREKVWDSFSCDLMTRLAPHHFVLVVGTRWHCDDLYGRIFSRNDPQSSDYDKEFPTFDKLILPAIDHNGRVLFPERYGPSWYSGLRASLGAYGWNAVGQQTPVAKGGNFFQADKVRIEQDLPENLSYRWGWDLASTEKQRLKDDPDYTV